MQSLFANRTSYSWYFLFTIFTKTIMDLTYPPPPNFFRTIVFDFSWGDCNTQEKLETVVI